MRGGMAAGNVAFLRWWAAAAAWAGSWGLAGAISARGGAPVGGAWAPGSSREALLEIAARRSQMGARARSKAQAGKPIRIFRGGEDQGVDEKIGAAREEAHEDPSQKCGVTEKVNSRSDKMLKCPSAANDPEVCPFYAQDKTDDQFCTFRCVSAKKCAEMNPKTPIADVEIGVCRSCIVDGCAECNFNTDKDMCARCESGFKLGKDGKCHNKYVTVLYVVGGIVGFIVLLLVLWVLDLCCRPVINRRELDRSLELREKQKLHMQPDESGERQLWPLTTNLMHEQVAGPGMSLHFTFHTFLIIWALLVALTWACFAAFVDPALWILGTRRFGTPRENCILVAWGYETQQRLMWTKVAFLWIVYIGSFILCLVFSVLQLRKFQSVDYKHKTMKDFAAIVEGMPSLEGDIDVEGELAELIRTKTGVQVVGVSVAWDYQEHLDIVNKTLHDDLKHTEQGPGTSPRPEDGEVIHTGIRRKLFNIERSLFAEAEEDESSDAEEAHPAIEDVLKSMRTSPAAFVVFETQAAKDAAVEMLSTTILEVEGTPVTLKEITCEPDTVQWVNFGHASLFEHVKRLVIGFGCILLACLFWAVVFYSPYAWYVMNFNYENGRQPGFIVGFSFSMIVVIGNAIMYEVCAQIADRVGFRYKDDREACYMILYTVACLFNILLDFVTTYKTAYYIMVGLGFRTYFGVPLDEVPTETELFETYAMQRSLAENTYSYAFPSTYLIPFLIEPFVAIGLPLYLGRVIVGRHPEIRGIGAEEWVASVPMEMGRYADLLLNVILGLLIFYFPGGYTAGLFLAMACSHVWIYIFDHWRVLRSIPQCVFASMDVDWWAQAMLAPCLGIVASCLVFKSNCEPGYHCIKGPTLVITCTAAWLLHVAVHLLLLKYLVPIFQLKPPQVDPEADKTFEQLARVRPCSWFTANPIHCLRSKYVHKHSPACEYYVLGKEHNMKINASIGCYYQEKPRKGKV